MHSTLTTKQQCQNIVGNIQTKFEHVHGKSGRQSDWHYLVFTPTLYINMDPF